MQNHEPWSQIPKGRYIQTCRKFYGCNYTFCEINMIVISYLPINGIYVRISIFIVHKSSVSVWFFYTTKSNRISKFQKIMTSLSVLYMNKDPFSEVKPDNKKIWSYQLAWIPWAKTKFIGCKFAVNAPTPNSSGLLWQKTENHKGDEIGSFKIQY